LLQSVLTLIQEIQSSEWWQDITVTMLESARKKLRLLIQFIEKKERRIVYTDFEDELGPDVEVTLPIFDTTTTSPFTESGNLENFRLKAKAFLNQHQNHITIRKLRMNAQLTKSDLLELEKIFTQNYSIISEDYKKFLVKYTQESFPNENNESYVRVWTRPVQSYAKNYSKFDVSLAPIKNHMFNRMKSQLKVIEAGFYKKALIASNVGPYTLDLKHSLHNGNFVDGNALLVDENRNHSDWSKFIEKLIKNPNMVIDMGERLYETVKDKYDLNVVTKARAEFYKSIV
jgi:type I site-specific restriction endonuclease